MQNNPTDMSRPKTPNSLTFSEWIMLEINIL